MLGFSERSAGAAGVREVRTIRTREMRSETEDGKQYLSGYAATYNTLSEELGWGMREIILPGAFTRALREKQDVRHLVNHDPTQVLGRTKAGTTVLSEDQKGLRFRTLINPDDPAAVSLAAKVIRSDIDECSFGFVARAQNWREEPDPEDEKQMRCIRELVDVDLLDISTVTYPAYPGTSAAVERSLFPDGVPAEVRAHTTGRMAGPTECACQCPACVDGDCEECSTADCADENCRCHGRSKAGKKGAKTKRVDGEDLKADCFLIVGDPDDTATWKLPWKFSTEEKTKTHLQNALARFNQLKGVSEEDKKAAWSKLVKLCKEHDIEVSEENSLWNRLTVEQRWELREPWETERARIKARVVEASA